MEKYFVSLEIAKMLKNLEFNEDCLAMYSYDLYDPNKKLTLSYDDGIVNGIIGIKTGEFFLAPLYQQALNFLREKYNYQVSVFQIYSNNKFNYTITCPDFTRSSGHIDGIFETYQECLEAGIKKVLSFI